MTRAVRCEAGSREQGTRELIEKEATEQTEGAISPCSLPPAPCFFVDRTSYTYADRIHHINDTYREFGRAIVTIETFVIYRPTGQIMPLVKNQDGRIYFTHWDNLKPIPLGQIELFSDDADLEEPPEPPELNDEIGRGNGSDRISISDIQRGEFWRTKSGFHPVTPVVGILNDYVIRCDVLPESKQVKMCQIRIRQQRSRIRDLKSKQQPNREIKNSMLIISEEKQRIFDLTSQNLQRLAS